MTNIHTHIDITYNQTVCLYFQANSFWLYIVPWGMYKTVNYVKERYGNPPIIISENGTG